MNKKIKEKLKSKSFSLGSIFFLLLTAVMLIAVICLTGFYFLVINQLQEQTINEKAYTNQAISTIVLPSLNYSLIPCIIIRNFLYNRLAFNISFKII